MIADMAQYLAALQAMDWHYERSDDHTVWVRQRDKRRALDEAQPRLDPEFKEWNRVAPFGFEDGRRG